MKTRQEVWREYAAAAASRGKPLVDAWAEADEMLRAEDARFGAEDADVEQLKREIAEARAQLEEARSDAGAAREAFARCNRMAKGTVDELNDRVDTLKRELSVVRETMADWKRELAEARAQLAASVPVVKLREALDAVPAFKPLWGLVRFYDAIVAITRAVEQRAGKAAP